MSSRTIPYALLILLVVVLVGLRLATAQTGNLVLAPAATASLTACSAANKYQISITNDAAATPVYNATATGGGSGVVLVLCDGTSWKNH